jgi:hypothetical protein
MATRDKPSRSKKQMCPRFGLKTRSIPRYDIESLVPSPCLKTC